MKHKRSIYVDSLEKYLEKRIQNTMNNSKWKDFSISRRKGMLLQMVLDKYT